jgi:hypothetical protein
MGTIRGCLGGYKSGVTGCQARSRQGCSGKGLYVRVQVLTWLTCKGFIDRTGLFCMVFTAQINDKHKFIPDIHGAVETEQIEGKAS